MDVGIDLDNSPNITSQSSTSVANNFKPDGAVNNSNDDKIDGSILKNEGTSEWMDVLGTGQLMKKVIVPGEINTRPERLDLCIINFCGSLEDGTVVGSEQNLEIHLGDCEVIPGIDLALALMDVGEQAKLIVSPRFGYGSLGLKPHIPPDVTMHYELTLSSVKHEPSISELSFQKRINTGNRKKDRGNWWYMRQENTFAIQCYRRALEYFDDTDLASPHTEYEVHALLEERLKTYNNLAAAQLKIKAYNAALISLEHVLACQPKNVKALYRKAKILKEKGDIDKSIELVYDALIVEPDSKSLHQELSNLLATKKEDNTKRKALYKKMLGNKKDGERVAADQLNKGNPKLWRWLVAIGCAVAVVGTLATRFKY